MTTVVVEWDMKGGEEEEEGGGGGVEEGEGEEEDFVDVLKPHFVLFSSFFFACQVV